MQQPLFMLDLCLMKTHDYRNTTIFEKKTVFKFFSVHTKMQSHHFQIPYYSKSVVKEFCFHDGLIRMVSLNVKITLYFQISLA